MKKWYCSLVFAFPSLLCAQKTAQDISTDISTHEVQAHIEFLASDEMRGRDTGSPELEIAANYIASVFKRNGLKGGINSTFFQHVPVQRVTPPINAEVTIDKQSFALRQDVLVYGGGNASLSGEFVYVGYGTAEDFEKTNTKGKIVVSLLGSQSTKSVQAAYLTDSPVKNTLAQKHGAIALIEIIAMPGVTFEGLSNFLNRERVVLKQENEKPMLPHLWLRNITDLPIMAAIKENKKTRGNLRVNGIATHKLTARNVIGMVEGKDPLLKKEIMVITAHYDHVGVGKKNAEGDSIFNGARDNALGTAALLSAAKYFGKNPAPRTILFIAFTAEEKGLLGSKWYTDHPVAALRETVFNLNADGGGYNDKTIVTINGMEYTTTEEELVKACQPFGLKAIIDPVPQYNLYAGSDNYSFATKGVPAINFAPGFRAFDEEIMKYYHQQPDHAETLDFEYVANYARSFVYAAVLFSERAKAPQWKPGVPFEEQAKQLQAK
jgi:hypothetical protein